MMESHKRKLYPLVRLCSPELRGPRLRNRLDGKLIGIDLVGEVERQEGESGTAAERGLSAAEDEQGKAGALRHTVG